MKGVSAVGLLVVASWAAFGLTRSETTDSLSNVFNETLTDPGFSVPGSGSDMTVPDDSDPNIAGNPGSGSESPSLLDEVGQDVIDTLMSNYVYGEPAIDLIALFPGLGLNGVYDVDIRTAHSASCDYLDLSCVLPDVPQEVLVALAAEQHTETAAGRCSNKRSLSHTEFDSAFAPFVWGYDSARCTSVMTSASATTATQMCGLVADAYFKSFGGSLTKDFEGLDSCALGGAVLVGDTHVVLYIEAGFAYISDDLLS